MISTECFTYVVDFKRFEKSSTSYANILLQVRESKIVRSQDRSSKTKNRRRDEENIQIEKENTSIKIARDNPKQQIFEISTR